MEKRCITPSSTVDSNHESEIFQRPVRNVMSVFVRWCFLLVLFVNAVWAQQIELVVEGNPLSLNSDQAKALGEKATAYVKSCWLSSLEIRAGTREPAFEPDWAREFSQNHVLMDFDPPLAVPTVDGTTAVQFALVSLHSGDVLGRNDQAEFSLLECSPRRFSELGCLEFLEGYVHDLPQEFCPALLKMEDYVVENPQYLEIRNGIFTKGENALQIRDSTNLLQDEGRALISSVFEQGKVWIVGSSGEAEGPKRAKAIIVLSAPLESPVEIQHPDGMTVLYYVDRTEVSIYPPDSALARRKIHLTQKGESTYIRIGGTTTEFANWSILRN